MRISDWSSDVCSSDLSIVAPVGKSGPGTIAINSSSVIAGLSIVASVASITSPRLCGGILFAMPTGITPAPLLTRLGQRAGRTFGSSGIALELGWNSTVFLACSEEVRAEQEGEHR